MSDTHPFCEDCRFYGGVIGFTHMCKYRKPTTGADFVTRDPVPSNRLCTVERTHEDADSCGLAGKWFEPKNQAE